MTTSRRGSRKQHGLGTLGSETSIRSLYEFPGRCPQTPEDSSLRHVLYGHKPHIYRVIYRILEKQKVVEVLHIRHGARDDHAAEPRSP